MRPRLFTIHRPVCRSSSSVCIRVLLLLVVAVGVVDMVAAELPPPLPNRSTAKGGDGEASYSGFDAGSFLVSALSGSQASSSSSSSSSGDGLLLPTWVIVLLCVVGGVVVPGVIVIGVLLCRRHCRCCGAERNVNDVVRELPRGSVLEESFRSLPGGSQANLQRSRWRRDSLASSATEEGLMKGDGFGHGSYEGDTPPRHRNPIRDPPDTVVTVKPVKCLSNNFVDASQSLPSDPMSGSDPASGSDPVSGIDETPSNSQTPVNSKAPEDPPAPHETSNAAGEAAEKAPFQQRKMFSFTTSRSTSALSHVSLESQRKESVLSHRSRGFSVDEAEHLHRLRHRESSDSDFGEFYDDNDDGLLDEDPHE